MEVVACYTTAKASSEKSCKGKKYMASILGCYRLNGNLSYSSSYIAQNYFKDNFAPPITNYTWQYSYAGEHLGGSKNIDEQLTTGRLTSESDLVNQMKTVYPFAEDSKKLNDGFPVLRWE